MESDSCVCVFLCVCVCVRLQAVKAQQLDELCFLTAQSMTSLRTSDHFQMVKLLGEGSYGKVMLAVHRKRGEWQPWHCPYHNNTHRRSMTWLICIQITNTNDKKVT